MLLKTKKFLAKLFLGSLAVGALSILFSTVGWYNFVLGIGAGLLVIVIFLIISYCILVIGEEDDR